MYKNLHIIYRSIQIVYISWSQNGARWGTPFLLLELLWLNGGGVDGEMLLLPASSPELIEPDNRSMENVCPSKKRLNAFALWIFLGVDDSSESHSPNTSLLGFTFNQKESSPSPLFSPFICWSKSKDKKRGQPNVLEGSKAGQTRINPVNKSHWTVPSHRGNEHWTQRRRDRLPLLPTFRNGPLNNRD